MMTWFVATLWRLSTQKPINYAVASDDMRSDIIVGISEGQDTHGSACCTYLAILRLKAWFDPGVALSTPVLPTTLLGQL